MKIVDKSNAHILAKVIAKYWTMIVADFNATIGPSVDTLSNWCPLQRKYICIWSNADKFHESVAKGTVNETNPSETMSTRYGITYDCHALE